MEMSTSDNTKKERDWGKPSLWDRLQVPQPGERAILYKMSRDLGDWNELLLGQTGTVKKLFHRPPNDFEEAEFYLDHWVMLSKNVRTVYLPSRDLRRLTKKELKSVKSGIA